MRTDHRVMALVALILNVISNISRTLSLQKGENLIEYINNSIVGYSGKKIATTINQ